MAGRLEVVAMPMAPGVRSQLLAAGFRTIVDLQDVTAQELAVAAGLRLDDAEEVIRVVHCQDPAQGWGGTADGVQVAQADILYASQRDAPRIMTCCQELDKLLGGGVPCGQVTEFVGVPGVGKTQMGIQLAVDVQIPVSLGGVGGAAVYMDTEGSFMVERVMDVASAAVRHVAACAKAGARTRPDGADVYTAEARQFSVARVLDNIHVLRVRDAAEQLAVLRLLPNLLTEHPEVRVVVIDSVTSHFRQDVRDMGLRARVLTGMAQTCMALAERFNVAVVFMNQVTTRVMGDSVAHLVPALGESWGHAASTRVVLHWQGQDRHAYLYKSPVQPCGTAQYQVTGDGIRDIRSGRSQQQAQPRQHIV